GVLAAPWVIVLFAPGFAGDLAQQGLAAEMLRVTFPYLLFIALTALSGGILNTLGKFALPAVTPALLNICLITAAVVFSDNFAEPIKALAWGVLIAGVLQLAVQLPALARHGLLPRPRPGFGHPGVRRIMKLMIPTLFGSSVAQINLLLDVLIASLLIDASISWLYYGDRLMSFPLGLFGVALSVVILPTLASLHARADGGQFRGTMAWAVLLGLVIGLPAAIGLAVLAGPTATTLFHYGEFAARDVNMTALALGAYCIGLPAFIGVKILAPAFYSRQDTRTPVRIAILALAANMVLNIGFVAAFTWQLAGELFLDDPWGALALHPGAHAGLALASSAAAWLNAGLLWKNLARQGMAPAFPWRDLARIAFAVLVMALALHWAIPPTADWLEMELAPRVARLVAAVGAGALVYALVLAALGLRPASLMRPRVPE
ncbi:MAG: murein biosynthesis integral membrane protein MurJ, partial [Wenzhouxiangellaceae bacterium]